MEFPKEKEWYKKAAKSEKECEEEMDEKKEFIVDKLGFYKTIDDEYFEIIRQLKNGNFYGINKCDYICEFLQSGLSYGKEYQLVEYLGEELPPKKVPRKFEFEASIREGNERYEPEKFDKSFCIISQKLGHYCTSFHKKDYIWDPVVWSKEDHVSKWKVIMEELLNDR